MPHLLVERHRGTAVHPRAASFHQRTMEIFRSVGLQEEVEAAAEKEFVQNGAIVSVESLAGRDMTYFFRNFNEGVEHLSPTARLFITQIGLEPVLRDTRAERGAEHLYGTELVGFEQDDDGVTAVIRSRDGGTEQTVRSDYLVAADGAHSKVRERSGIEMAGRGTFADCVTIYFRADMRELIGDRNLSVVYVNHPELLGFFRFSITGDSGFLAVFSTTEPDGTATPTWPRTWTRTLRRPRPQGARPRPTSRWTIDNVQRWTRGGRPGPPASRTGGSSLPATRPTSCPRPAGSAATPASPTRTTSPGSSPWCWTARPGPALLDTYDAERRPVCSLTVEQAYTRYVLRVDPSLPRDDMAAPLDDASIELGPVYRSAAVLDRRGRRGAPGRPAPARRPARHPCAAPGGRARRCPGVDARRLRPRVRPARRPRPGSRGATPRSRWPRTSACRSSAHRVAADGTVVDPRGVVPGGLRHGHGGRRPRAAGRRRRLADPAAAPDPRAELERRRADGALPLAVTGRAAPAAAGRGGATAGRPPGRRRPPSRTRGCRR